jgi:hypothetical protein
MEYAKMDMAAFELQVFGNELPYFGVYRQQEVSVGYCSRRSSNNTLTINS